MIQDIATVFWRDWIVLRPQAVKIYLKPHGCAGALYGGFRLGSCPQR